MSHSVEEGGEQRRLGRQRCGRPWWRRWQREVGEGANEWAPAMGDWEREGGSVGLVGQIGQIGPRYRFGLR
jgi:hypothetical protein